MLILLQMKQQMHDLFSICSTNKILRNGGRNMINKGRLNDFTIRYNNLVDLGLVAYFANFTYDTLPQNQEFEF